MIVFSFEQMALAAQKVILLHKKWKILHGYYAKPEMRESHLPPSQHSRRRRRYFIHRLW